ncbi:hypothetical protein AAFF_G00106040 [Aldrovandia affinis]|uniref:Uncharacterized protein n=1 Tax=Aldrovandia affinis TaxID=143900 RepID=A0AAD7WXP1_9TELE|nr:hypothetical protein AAFF_G00106040 [Aldrovandia affinis]
MPSRQPMTGLRGQLTVTMCDYTPATHAPSAEWLVCANTALSPRSSLWRGSPLNEDTWGKQPHNVPFLPATFEQGGGEVFAQAPALCAAACLQTRANEEEP